MSINLDLEDTVVTSTDAIWCDLKGEVVVLHLSSGVYFGLEGVGPEMWQFMQTPRTLNQVVDHLTSQYDVPADVCRSRTLAFVQELAQRDLVVVTKNAVAVR